MLRSIVVLTLFSAVTVFARSAITKSAGWNGLLNAAGIFEENLNSIEVKSGENEVIQQQLQDLLGQDETLKSIYMKYRATFKKTNDVSWSRMNKLKYQLLVVAKHNLEAKQGKHSWWMGVNQFTDQTEEEIQVMFSPRQGSPISPNAVPIPPKSVPGTGTGPVKHAPHSLNYVEKGIVTRIKNQWSCNSCCMFSSASALESAVALKYNQEPVSLSPQQLMDCAIPNWNCSIGSDCGMSLDYMKENGVASWADYPYEPKEGAVGDCQASSMSVAATLATQTLHFHVEEEDIKNLVAKHGPVVAYIWASNNLVQNYGGGVYTGDEDCDAHGDWQNNHAITIVGYDKDQESGLDYWLIKNQWDTTWGEKGYLWLQRNAENVCNVGAQVYWVTSA